MVSFLLVVEEAHEALDVDPTAEKNHMQERVFALDDQLKCSCLKPVVRVCTPCGVWMQGGIRGVRI